MAILHTDAAQHFSMIKEVQMLYEVNSDVLEPVLFGDVEEDDIDGMFPADVLEVFRKPEARKLLGKVILHTSDISNSIKPFRICRIWAYQVLEEFFNQGDQEKKLGFPVQALNDRSKVNRAFSQIGFIELLVAPLWFSIIKVLPPLEPLLDQLLQNAKTWHQSWLADTKPTPSDSDKRGIDERLYKLQQRHKDLYRR